MSLEKRIIIIGAGPTGLGAAFSLTQLGYKNWVIYEKNNYVGGLSASFKDAKGFTWDIGGHVLFSNYPRFESIFEGLLKGQYLTHERRAFIRAFDKWIPYPFQNNLRYLPRKYLLECIYGVIEAQRGNGDSKNFMEWVYSSFGEGIARYFMVPHNSKVWTYPLERMDKNWISDRVSPVNVTRILENIIYERDDVSWGPNNKFKFPLYGGTQSIFKKVEPLISGHLHLKHELCGINTKKKVASFKDSSEDRYDILINTSPLDSLMRIISPARVDLLKKADTLKHNSVLIVGVGLEGRCPERKCWIYAPEDKSPFFRATYFSNYSPNNVPDDRKYWSVMCETAYSPHRPRNKRRIIEETLDGLKECSIIKKGNKNKVVSTYLIDSDYAYPIPTLKRDLALNTLQGFLENNRIFSRGRFGAWKYEIGNMDHSFMQGIEIVEKLLLNKKESVWKG